MFVIDRNNGHCCCNVGRSVLLEGKSYMVIIWSYHSPMVTWKNNTQKRDIPKSAQFFIRIINEDGVEHDYWNDYFFFDRRNETIKNRTI
jgi:hypothetical protein